MNPEQRIASARSTDWVKTYPGKKLVKGYKKAFNVDTLTAIAELRILGVMFPKGYEQRVRQAIIDAAAARKRKKEERKRREEELFGNDSDETFAFIAGYTTGGVPFGVTWEESEEGRDVAHKKMQYDDYPF
jgi:hypothetical protein